MLFPKASFAFQRVERGRRERVRRKQDASMPAVCVDHSKAAEGMRERLLLRGIEGDVPDGVELLVLLITPLPHYPLEPSLTRDSRKTIENFG